MKSPDRQTRLEAAKVLLKVGKEGSSTNPAVPGLQVALRDEDPEVRGWSAVAMMYAAKGTPFPVGPLVIPQLKEAAKSEDKELRAEAEELLKKMPSGGEGPPGRGGPNRGNGQAPPAETGKPAEGGKAAPDEKKAPAEEKKPSPKPEEKKPSPGPEQKKSAPEKEKP
jgi:hypothetical protein